MISHGLSFRAKRGIWVFLLLFCELAVAQGLPPGWRRPTKAEASEEWRQKSLTRFLVVRGDFDGDGRRDLAELLVSDSGKEFGLWVQLSSQGGQWQMIHGGHAPLGELGIYIVRPGKYDTLCGDDPSMCAPGAPQHVNLTTDAVGFMSWGSTSSFFFWDQATKKFRNAPQGD